MLFALLDDVHWLLCSAPALMPGAFFQLWKQHVSISHQGDTHRISRHAMSLFNCDWFEEY